MYINRMRDGFLIFICSHRKKLVILHKLFNLVSRLDEPYRMSRDIMSCVLLLGTQWGDEGKAKIIDYISRNSDIVVRYQGGANAGHTVVVGDRKYIFHHIPSGILHRDKMCVIANGVVVDPVTLNDEIDLLERDGYDVMNHLLISDAAHVIFPYHKALDEAMEEFRDKKIGTTKRGIGPSYSDKSLRIGIRIGDMLHADYLRERIAFVLKLRNLQFEMIYKKPVFQIDAIVDTLLQFKERIGGMITNTQYYLHESLRGGKKILLEGAQGNALDIDHGTYPYVTSSNPTIGGALIGTGLSAFDVDKVIGITKAYVTRVGEGPFPTEERGEDGDRLREVGKEFGSTTGRPRRCGWFDVELLKHTIRINGLSEIALTKLDVLTGLKRIKIAVGYEMKGKKLEYFPSAMLQDVEPVYEELDGWDEEISSCKKYSELPANAIAYVDFIEKTLDTRVSIISVGPERESTFIRE